jgi:glycosyltransferase involved in cell wall biosynthesis
MRVLIINTSEQTGGAAVAAKRLMEALNNEGVKAKMLVKDKETDCITVAELPHPWRRNFNFLWERWSIFCHLHFHRDHLFDIDTARMGSDVTRTREFQEADIIHLAWVNQGMLSLKGIRKILQSGKPVVWTMHDIWPATAICHLAKDCTRFEEQCHNCPYLPGGGSEHDLAYRVWKRKARTLAHHNIAFVACSKWLEREAKKSRLLSGQMVVSIPNPIDTHIFHPADAAEARQALGLPTDKKLLLFVSQRVTNVNKGIGYLVDACHKMVEAHPEMRENTAVVVLGGHAEEVEPLFDLPVYALGYVSDEHRIALVYNAVNLFVLPSLSENLPNTIMEALACGVPCVGFNVGGIPEMIEHQRNGYVARLKDADDLAQGLHWVLAEADPKALAEQAVAKVHTAYSQRSVAMKYIEVYNQAIALKHYHL